MSTKALSLLAQLRSVVDRTRNFSIYFLLNVIQRGMGLILLPFYTATLAPSEYGIVALSWALSIVTTVFYLCIPDALYFAVLREDEHVRAYVSAGLRLMLAIFAAGIAALALLSQSDAQGEFAGIALNPYLWLILALNLPQGFVDTRLQILQAEQRATSFFRIGASRIALQFGAVLSILTLAPSALNLLLGQFAVNILMLALVTPWLLRNVAPPGRGRYKQCIVFALPLIPHTLAHWGRSSLDRVLLGQYAGASVVGKYSIAATVASALSMITEAYRNFHVPLQFAWFKNDAGDRDSLRFYSVGFVAAIGIVSLLLVAVAPSLYALFVSNVEYHQGISLLPILAGSSVAYAVYINVVPWIFFNESSHVVALRTTTVSAAAVPVSWFLISHFGMEGAAAGQFLGTAAMAAVVYMRCRRYTDFHVPALSMAAITVILPSIGLATFLSVPQWPLLAGAFALCSAVLVHEVRVWKRAAA